MYYWRDVRAFKRDIRDRSTVVSPDRFQLTKVQNRYLLFSDDHVRQPPHGESVDMNVCWQLPVLTRELRARSTDYEGHALLETGRVRAVVRSLGGEDVHCH